jgi:hypothetical protein
MFTIEYVIARNDDSPVDKVPFAGDRWEDAFDKAKKFLRDSPDARAPTDHRPPVIGFVIREYGGGD